MTMANGSPGSVGSAWNSFSSFHTLSACGSIALVVVRLGKFAAHGNARNAWARANEAARLQLGFSKERRMLRNGGSPDNEPG
jgi:hypothetical protein